MAWLFAITLVLSSSLLFLLQPMCAKMLLAPLGGTPAVWNTCMVFFQGGLLAGYCYAHFGPRLLGEKRHAFVHMLLLALALVSLPVTIPRELTPPASPVWWLIQTLLVAVGLPFFVIAACGPLLQRWYLRASAGRDPYFLYAASNLGSFAALVVYPFLMEPYLSLKGQASLWMLAYVPLVAASLACALCLAGKAGPERAGPSGQFPDAVTPGIPPARVEKGTRLRWVLLALVPCSLMLSVTSYLTTDIAAIPLLWVIPLGIYLLTFTLVFARHPWLPHQAMVRWMPLVVIVLALMILQEGTEPLLVVLGLHLLGLFWLAMVCHGELARTRPAADQLTEFYLWLTVGGVLGGLFNALVAPLIFKSLVEYPLMIALACLLRPAAPVERICNPSGPARTDWKSVLRVPVLVGGLAFLLVFLGRALDLPPGPASVAVLFAGPLVLVYLLQRQPVPFGLGLALVFLASSFYAGVHGTSSYRQRSFFGVHRVTEQDGFRKLFHGNILHGQQSLDPSRRDEPLTYYHRGGPIGQVLTSLQDDDRLKRVGLIGLGTGALASYSEPGQHWTFFEIDPAVVHIAAPATGLFSYLKDSKGCIDVVLGDGRMALSRQQEKFGLLVVDAFGSDAIPLHLLTREALQVYLAHLRADGILALHISNRYVDLEPVLANLAGDAEPPLVCRIQHDLNLDLAGGKSPSVWVVMVRASGDLAPLAQSTRWQRARSRPDLGVWTDDFSNLVSVLRWGE